MEERVPWAEGKAETDHDIGQVRSETEALEMELRELILEA